MKVTRADWAGSVSKKAVEKAVSELVGGTPADLTALTARVAALEAAIIALGQTSGSADTGLTSLSVWWSVGSMEPLQMVYEDIAVTVAPADGRYAVSSPFSINTGVFFAAYALGAGYVRLIAVNLSGTTLTIPMTNYTLFSLNG